MYSVVTRTCKSSQPFRSNVYVDSEAIESGGSEEVDKSEASEAAESEGYVKEQTTQLLANQLNRSEISPNQGSVVKAKEEIKKYVS
jgi:hypothetical protein